MNLPRTVLVVGAGLAGARCAETLRAEGFEGRLVLVGEEPHEPYERPALSKEFLAGARDSGSLRLRPPSFWGGLDIELRLATRIVGIDTARRTAATGRGEELAWDALVLATGARPRRLPFAAPKGVHVLRTLADAAALREELMPGSRLVVIGGGFVGAEVASTALGLGVEVTMLEAGAAPFARTLGPELGRLLASRCHAHGVDLRTQSGASGFRASDRLEAVVLPDGTELPCDVALVAVGVEPTRELLPRAFGTDVHVCGDASGGPGHWTSAAADAVDTARAILGLGPLPAQPPYFWSDQFGLRIQLVGDPRGMTHVELEGDEDAFVARYLAADGRLLAALASNRPAAVGPLRRELALAA
jgi:3-phenylpropionate/trans-cinnamate dioxygenase ferredoxin reductase component